MNDEIVYTNVMIRFWHRNRDYAVFDNMFIMLFWFYSGFTIFDTIFTIFYKAFILGGENCLFLMLKKHIISWILSAVTEYFALCVCQTLTTIIHNNAENIDVKRRCLIHFVEKWWDLLSHESILSFRKTRELLHEKRWMSPPHTYNNHCMNYPNIE